MKLKHYKFPPQSYPPRIRFKLNFESELIMADEDGDKPMSTVPMPKVLEEPLECQTCMIDTQEN